MAKTNILYWLGDLDEIRKTWADYVLVWLFAPTECFSFLYIYILIYYHYLFTFWVPGVSTVSKLENIILLLFIPCILFKFIYLCTKFLIFLRYNLLTFNENLMFLQMHVFVEIYLLKLIWLQYNCTWKGEFLKIVYKI